MKWYTHVTCMVLTLTAMSRFFPLTTGFVLFSLIGSVLPDILEKWLGLTHRNKYIHNYDTAVMVLLAGLFSQLILALGIGWLYHLLLDTLTVRGTYLFDDKIRWRLKTTNPFHNMLTIMVHVLLLAIIMTV